MVTSIANTIEYKRELKREIEKLRHEEHLEIFKRTISRLYEMTLLKNSSF